MILLQFAHLFIGANLLQVCLSEMSEIFIRNVIKCIGKQIAEKRTFEICEC